MKCWRVSGSVERSLHVGFTANWLKAARLACKMYVQVSNLHFIYALLLSCALFLSVDQTWCDAPIFNTFAFINMYFVEDLFAISDFQDNSTISCILQLSVHSSLGGVLHISSNTDGNPYRSSKNQN